MKKIFITRAPVRNAAGFPLHLGCTHSKYLYCYNPNVLSRATKQTRRSFDASESKIALRKLAHAINRDFLNFKN